MLVSALRYGMRRLAIAGQVAYVKAMEPHAAAVCLSSQLTRSKLLHCCVQVGAWRAAFHDDPESMRDFGAANKETLAELVS